eukprot:976148-Pelagomonas_calceolata.AAC.2
MTKIGETQITLQTSVTLKRPTAPARDTFHYQNFVHATSTHKGGKRRKRNNPIGSENTPDIN